MLTKQPYKQMYFDRIVPSDIKTVIEAGVFIGDTTLRFAQVFDAEVHAFEPCYEEFKQGYKGQCYYNQILNDPRITVHPIGLHKTSGKVKFNKEEIFAHSGVRENGAIEIEVTSIDEYVSSRNLKVDFIKIDTEGSEIPILEGALKTIVRDRPQLAIASYHGWQQLIEVPVMMHNLLEDYTFFVINYHPQAQQAETIFYCIPNELRR